MARSRWTRRRLFLLSHRHDVPLARPGLRRLLAESEPTLYETSAVDGLRARVDKREAKDVSKSFTKEPAAWA